MDRLPGGRNPEQQNGEAENEQFEWGIEKAHH